MLSDVAGDLLDQARHAPQAIAFSDDTSQVTWRVLARRAAGLAAGLADAPPVIGLFVPDGLDWVVCDLAVKLAGRILVPLPCFFGAEQ
jgi:acyl-CoA synthetase (AMP-forming)/AMP-acid ligase II